MTDIEASLGATERDEGLRAAWRVTAAGEAGIDARRLVFRWSQALVLPP